MTAPGHVAIVGAACRLPGAADEAALRTVLGQGLFTVGALPNDRWHPELLFHPDPKVPGSAYTFAGGYLENPYDFDIGAFGMSPREAAQVDPQQRLLAEVVWEALEDARIPPTALQGQEVGVYIGVSALDHANLFGGDPMGIESHFMTGNTLSVVANRISYLYDLRGPSFVVDTACSSSLVAVDRAVADLRSGRIDTAIVGGVNMLLSPASFVGFSRASMLSPTGACRPFSADADGYVRAEGAVVFVLRRPEAAVPGSIRAMIAATAVNSDGRTSGIALPGLDGQRRLLELAYRDVDFAPGTLDFVEAHGTGTAVGDPIEATAIGDVLGRKRSSPLPIGSIKSNIGHLEPASGAAGMLKALIALEQRQLPRTLHIAKTNPLIDFDKLGLAPAASPVALGEGILRCGVSSFGFGGTNAHVVMTTAPELAPLDLWRPSPDVLTISAHCREALAATALAHAVQLDAGADPGRLAGAVAGGRALLRHRAVLPIGEAGTMADALRGFAGGSPSPVVAGSAPAAATSVCFVYSGNGTQWAGMGRAAYAANRTFAKAFDEVDRAFSALGFDSLVATMQADDLAERLGSAGVAQPLIFAIQVATSAALGERGLRPASVIGHSVGEIGAAWAAGAFRIEQAVRIVAARAASQEAVRGAGGMATLAADRASVARLIAQNGEKVQIAAENGPLSVTVAGTKPAIAALLKAARAQRIAGLVLDIDYPYHSSLLDGIRGHFIAETGIVHASEPRIPMISTVTGEAVEDAELDAQYWWRNIRSEVQFRRAVRTAAERGANLFIEIGPRSILAAAIAGSVEDAGLPARVIPSLGENDSAKSDPIDAIWARAIANGFAPPPAGPRLAPVDRSAALPHYPWQRRTYRHRPGTSAIDIHGNIARHPLAGARTLAGGSEWRSVLDSKLVPYLADHVVGGEIVVPATALAEMALAVGRDLWPDGALAVEDFDVLQAMVLPPDAQREVSIRFSEGTGTIEISSRPRPGGDEWTLCARGRIVQAEAAVSMPPSVIHGRIAHRDADTVYAAARRCGLDYGPEFRLFRAIRRDDDKLVEAEIALPGKLTGAFTRGHVLHPASLDAALHALFELLEQDDGAADKAWLPIRFERLVVLRDAADVVSATLSVVKSSAALKTLDIWLRDDEGRVVARLENALLRSVRLSRHAVDRGMFHIASEPAGIQGAGPDLFAVAQAHFAADGLPERSEGWLLLKAHMRSALRQTMGRIAGPAGAIDPDALVAEGRVDKAALPWLRAMLGEMATAGMLLSDQGNLILAGGPALPEPDLVLASFAAEFPLASVDLALSGNAAAMLTGNGPVMVPRPRAGLIERAGSASLGIEPAARALVGSLDALCAASSVGALHVVVAGELGTTLIAALVEGAMRRAFRLSVAAADRATTERLRRRLPQSADIDVIDLSEGIEPVADVVLLLRRDGTENVGIVGRAAGLLRRDGIMIAATPAEDVVAVFQGISPANRTTGLTDILADEPDFSGHARFGGEGAAVVEIARKTGEPGDVVRGTLLCLSPSSERSEAILDHLSQALEQLGTGCARIGSPAALGLTATGESVLYLVDGAGPEPLSDTLLGIAGALAELRDRVDRPKLWIVALSTSGESSARSAALRAFARVAINEAAGVDVRFVEIGAGQPDHAIAAALASRIADPGREREVSLLSGSVRTPRLRQGLPRWRSDSRVAEAVRLHFPRPGMLENFEWVAASRPLPGPGEVAVEVAATGLNFRDVMLAMGLLADDVLEDGLAGAVYGLECAGRIAAVGEGVTRHRVGDPVFGFGMDSFASHVCGPERSFVPLPEGLPVEAAAGLPVAFYTAWYALVELARLRAGEKVLIHGGAGGVGLAAIQIAAALGAEVIATVSSPDKEALARLYGAAHVHDSRSLAFVDLVRERHGGVDVVLNSLSGEAMRGGIRCLRPRGRFVELGKRDYVANSTIGLRPFRRNLSYFGVDIDQLLALDPEMTAKGLAAILEGFADGSFLPLPVMAHRASEIGEAFRLMQSSGHVGKIVISPPAVETVAAPPAEGFVAGDDVQLVVGGTRGFGLATALWLARRGARRIVVASLSGKLDPAARVQIEALRKDGVTFAVERVDVTDRAAVEALFARIAATQGPVGAIYHAAVTLRDAMIEGLTAEDLAAVLAPKIAGAANLDSASRSHPVAQFVLYSSVSALVGNPGQAAYAAANGYLEGLARSRRGEGLPALAVQWGAIADVGLLADRADTLESLARVSGVVAMQSADALDRLATILARADTLPDPVITCADFAANGALLALPVAQSPAFAEMLAGRASSVVEAGKSLAELIADKSEPEARKLLCALLAEEVAQILRLAAQEVDLDAPIDSLGMDSLMALELRMSIESRYRVELPVMAITAAGSLRELALRILRIVQKDDDAGESAAVTAAESALIASHGGETVLKSLAAQTPEIRS